MNAKNIPSMEFIFPSVILNHPQFHPSLHLGDTDIIIIQGRSIYIILKQDINIIPSLLWLFVYVNIDNHPQLQ